MAQVKTISIPIQGGMRQDVSDLVAPPGTIRSATNVRFPFQGEVQSRRGTEALSVVTSADVAYADMLTDGPDFLAPCPGGFVFGAGGFGYRYDLAQGRVYATGSYSNAVPEGRFAVITSEGTEVTVDEAVPLSMGVAVGGGYVVACWSSGQGAALTSQSVVVQVYTENGALVASIVENSYSSGVVLYDDVSDSFILVIHDASGTDLVARRLSVSATGVVVAQTATVGTLGSSTATFTAANWPGIGWALAYRTAFDEITLKQLTGVTTLDTEVIADGRSAAFPISLYCDTTHLYLGWTEDNGANCIALARVYSTALALTSGGTVTVHSVSGFGTNCFQAPLFGASVTAGTAFGAIAYASVSSVPDIGGTTLFPFTITSAGVVTIVATSMRNVWPVSAPFANGMVWCMYRLPFAFAFANNYWRLVLLDFMNDRATTSAAAVKLGTPVVALCGDAFADPMGGSYMGGRTKLQQYAPQSADGELWFHAQPRLVRSEHDEATGNNYGLVVADVVKFRTGTSRQSCAFGSETLVAGSPVLLTDTGSRGTTTGSATDLANQRLGVDLGLMVEPSLDNPVQSTTAGGQLTVTGVYQYRAVLEWVDGTGRRWRSRPSRVRVETMTGTNDTCTFTSDDDYSWFRQSGLSCSQVVKHYYRTVSGGSTFYRVTPPQGAPVARVGIAFVDEVSDAALAQREILYTDGGVLDNDHPPSCRYIRATEDRVWCAGLWDATQAQSSKILVPGEPPQFSDSPAFRVVVPENITGLAIQDGVVVLFARGSIYAVQGTGPSDQGQGAWETPRSVTRSTGCVDGRSVLETSAGIFFQSDRGIELLPRGMGEPLLIGDAVQTALGESTVVSCAVIKSAESTTARFVTSAGIVLVYDLDMQAWSVDSYPVAITAICDTDGGAVLAKASASGGYGFYFEQGDAAQDSVGDNPAEIASTITWAQLRPFGVAGQGRFGSAIALFAAQESPSAGYRAGNATIKLTVDRFSESGKVFSMSTALATNDYMRHSPNQQIGSSGRLTLDTAAAGWRFSGWTVELDDIGGGRRMGETEQG